MSAMTTMTAPRPKVSPHLGSFEPNDGSSAFSPEDLLESADRIHEPCFVIRDQERGRVGVAFGDAGQVAWGQAGPYQFLACLPPASPEMLGDTSFAETHRVRFPYVAGEMAQGI